jgi:hypothetical protein
MLALDASISGIDPLAWRNLARLFLPPPLLPPPAAGPGQGRTGTGPREPRLFCFFARGGQLVQLLYPGAPVHDHEALLRRCADLYRGPSSLPALRRAASAPFAALVEDDGLFLLARAVEGRIRPGDDLLTQGVAVAEALRQSTGPGRKLHLDPNPFVIGIPRADTLLRAADLLLPDDRSMVLYIVDMNGTTAQDPAARGRPRVWTSLVIGKRRGQVTSVTTHLGLGFSAPSRDLRGDARLLGRAASTRVAPPHLGLYITLDAWRRVIGPQPGALARAAALGEAVIEPMPTWFLATAGLGAATGIAEGAGKLLGRFVPKGVLDAAKQVGMSPFQVIGIDPLELWGQITGFLRAE